MEIPTPSMDPGAYTAQLEDLERDALELQSALEGVRGTAESPDGLVQATTSGRGELIELILDPRIYRTADAEALAQDITKTIQEATTRAQEQVYAKARRGLFPAGTDPETVDLEFDAFLEHVRQAKGNPAP
jgi:DNA-binding protein YbaB